MDWSDVVEELKSPLFASCAHIDLADISAGDPLLGIGVRAIARETGVRTVAELADERYVEAILRAALPRQDRRAFIKAFSSALRRRARAEAANPSSSPERTPAPPPPAQVATTADEVPRGGDALSAWAARTGTSDALLNDVRVMMSPQDRRGVVFNLRALVDLELHPATGAKQGLDRASMRLTGLNILRDVARQRAPEVAARGAFLARRHPPADPWLSERIALLAGAKARLAAPGRVTPPLDTLYPSALVTFVAKPPSLAVRIYGVEHLVMLGDGALTNRGAQWHGTAARLEVSAAILDAAVDALSDPDGPARRAALAWRETPPHEHLLSDLREALFSTRQRSVVAASEGEGEGEEEERIAFRLAEDFAGVPTVVLQRAKKAGGFTVGRRVSASEALYTPRMPPLDRELLELCVMLETARYSLSGGAVRSTIRLLELLAEHPRVSLDDAAKTPIIVRRARACVRVAPSGEGYRVEVVVGGLVPDIVGRADSQERHVATVVDPATSMFHFAELDAPTMALARALQSHTDPLPAGGVDALLHMLATYPDMDVDLVLPDELRGSPVTAEERLIVQLSLSPDGVLGLGLRVRPLPQGPALVPGVPPRHAYGTVGDVRVFATRNLDDEESRAEHLLAELPLAGAERRAPFDLRVDDAERACNVVASLAELSSTDAVAIEWAPGARLVVRRTLGMKSLKLRVDRKRDWFGLAGGAEVDGAQIGIHALLEAARAGRRFVKLEGGDLVAIDRQLRERLERADDLVHASKDGLIAPPTSLTAIGELVESEDEQLTAAREWLELRVRVRQAEASEPSLPRAGFDAELRAYQLDGYRWMIRLAACASGGCLADDMGLGKTVQSLAVLVARSELGPALVVAPMSVGPNWISEAARFAPGLRCIAYRGKDRSGLLADLGPGAVVITSYDIVLRDEEALAAIHFATAIFDEAHALKNAHAKRAGAVRKLQADVRFALTGTPVENHTGELWSLFRSIVPGLFGSWERFRERFAGPIERDRDPVRRAALASVIQPYLLRRTKAEVAPELPPRTEIVRFVELSAPERELYEAERQRAVESHRSEGSKEAGVDGRFALLAALTRLRQLACHPRLRHVDSSVGSAKLASVLALIGELRDAGHRALVFSQFTGHLAILGEALAARGITFFELTGATPSETRADRVARFQRGEAELFLISLKAGGTGLNLTAADHVIHLDPWWNPAAEDQASDRAHRIGQDKPVTVVRVIARGTIEESVLALHAEKRELASAILGGGDVAARLSTSELFALMEKTASDDAGEAGDDGDAAGDELIT